MPVYIAHYKSLDSSTDHVSGSFEFESTSRLGTKANAHDARLEMLERFGNTALSWSITEIERRRANAEIDGQQELDFRNPSKKRRSNTQRGRL